MIDPSHPLYGAYLRVLRADRYLTEAKDISNEFADACKKHIVSHHDPKTGHDFYRLDGTPELSPIYPFAVSDAIHNLRAALDYVVYELARFDSKKIQDGTQFLIEDVKSDPLKRDRGFDYWSKKRLKGLSPAHVSAIEDLQPYKGVQWTKTLRDISNPDKHRQLTTITNHGSEYIVLSRGDVSVDDDGVVTFVGDPRFEVHTDYAIRISLPDGPLPLLPTLYEIETQVTEVIYAFKFEF